MVEPLALTTPTQGRNFSPVMTLILHTPTTELKAAVQCDHPPARKADAQERSMEIKLLVVDDEPGILKLISAIVEPMGCKVQAMSDSRQAAESVQSEKFDGVILDVRMPHVDGFELAQRVRSSPINKGVPIVMLTGYDDSETMRKCFKAGATFFLGKPVEPTRVSGLINAMRGAKLRERRRHVRLPFRTTVIVRAGTKYFKANSLNISVAGMLLDTSDGAEPGQDVGLEFLMPDSGQPIRVRGKVVRKEEPNSIGVEFIVLSPSDQDAIQRYILGTTEKS